MIGNARRDIAHFTVNCRYRLPEECFGGTAYGQDAKRRREQRQRLKEVGFRERYHQFNVNDPVAKERALLIAGTEAALWTILSGVECEVFKGCWL